MYVIMLIRQQPSFPTFLKLFQCYVQLNSGPEEDLPAKTNGLWLLQGTRKRNGRLQFAQLSFTVNISVVCNAFLLTQFLNAFRKMKRLNGSVSVRPASRFFKVNFADDEKNWMGRQPNRIQDLGSPAVDFETIRRKPCFHWNRRCILQAYHSQNFAIDFHDEQINGRSRRRFIISGLRRDSPGSFSTNEFDSYQLLTAIPGTRV